MLYPLEKYRFAKRPASLIEVAPFPPPYRRMLAINSDVEFTTWKAQLDIMQVFADLDLETAGSFWMYNDPQMTWRMLEPDGSFSAEGVAALGLARAGLLDTLHSFGGTVNGRGVWFDRNDIARAYRVLRENGVATRVYSNHGTEKDTQNIGGAWVTRPGTLDYQKGDVPEDQRYHLDLSLEHGLRFFWLDVDRWRHVNWFAPRVGKDWFEPSEDGDDTHLFVRQISRDGRPILRFRRTDAMEAPDGANLGRQLDRILADQRTGYCALYTHLGILRDDAGRPIQNVAPYFNVETRQSLERLAEAQDRGDILVTTTQRLLMHALLMAAQPWKLSLRDGRYWIEIERRFEFAGAHFELGWSDLAGLSFMLKSARRVFAVLDGERRELERRELGGKTYTALPWHKIDMKSALAEARRHAFG